MSVQNTITGTSAVEIGASIEAGIREGRLGPGAVLPTVRGLAADLSVSPATVAAAYRTLKTRGLLQANRRRGTRVSPRPPLVMRPGAPVPPGARDCARGNPDRALLPDLGEALAKIDSTPRLYGETLGDPELIRLARRDFEADRIPAGHLTVVGGALDGIERVLLAHLRPGDRVAVEDPGFTAVLDLLPALGLTPVPLAIDESGPLPEAVERACEAGIAGMIVTPRAQNPLGAALDASRARALRAILRRHPDVLVIEDDHAGVVAGSPAFTLCEASRARFAVVRSVSKSLGPDLRVAVLATDAGTLARVEGRQLLGIRWVSHVLQGLVVALWKDRAVKKGLRVAERTYAARRTALLEALRAENIGAFGRSGMNVWVPVAEETSVVQQLLDRGWAVSGGERFRIDTPPAIRITISALPIEDAPVLAQELARILNPVRRTLSA